MHINIFVYYYYYYIENRWYRLSNGTRNGTLLQGVLKPGGGRDFPTISTLTIEPTRKDDGVDIMCEVRNRALSSDEKMASTVRLNVNCELRKVF